MFCRHIWDICIFLREMERENIGEWEERKAGDSGGGDGSTDRRRRMGKLAGM